MKKREEKKRERSTKPLRNCGTERLLFLEAGQEQKNDRHPSCTWSNSALTVTQTNIFKTHAHRYTFGTNFPIACSEMQFSLFLVHFKNTVKKSPGAK